MRRLGESLLTLDAQAIYFATPLQMTLSRFPLSWFSIFLSLPEYQAANRGRRSTNNRDGTPEHPIIAATQIRRLRDIWHTRTTQNLKSPHKLSALRAR